MVRQHIHEEKIVDYVLGKLSTEEHFKVYAHLTNCKRCASQRDHWEKYLNVETVPIPSPTLKQKIFTNIQQKRNKFNHKFAYIAVSFCIAIILCIGIFQFSKSTPSTNPEDVSTNLTEQDKELIEFIRLYATDHQSIDQHTLKVLNNEIWKSNMKYHKYIYDDPLLKHYDLRPIELSRPSNEQIIFISHGSICSYDINRKQILCVQMDLDSNKIDEKTLQFFQ